MKFLNILNKQDGQIFNGIQRPCAISSIGIVRANVGQAYRATEKTAIRARIVRDSNFLSGIWSGVYDENSDIFPSPSCQQNSRYLTPAKATGFFQGSKHESRIALLQPFWHCPWTVPCLHSRTTQVMKPEQSTS